MTILQLKDFHALTAEEESTLRRKYQVVNDLESVDTSNFWALFLARMYTISFLFEHLLSPPLKKRSLPFNIKKCACHVTAFYKQNDGTKKWNEMKKKTVDKLQIPNRKIAKLPHTYVWAFANEICDGYFTAKASKATPPWLWCKQAWVNVW